MQRPVQYPRFLPHISDMKRSVRIVKRNVINFSDIGFIELKKNNRDTRNDRKLSEI